MPTDAEYETMIRQADDLWDVGKTEEAKAALRLALKQAEETGDQAFVHCLRGALRHYDHDRERHLEEQRKAISLSPDSYLLNIELGAALGWAYRREEALECFDRALTLKPDCPAALRGRAVAACNMGRYDEGLKDLDSVLDLNPDDPHGLQVRASALLALDRAEDALKSVERSLAIRPNSVAALCCKARILSSLGRHEEAFQAIEKAGALRGDDPSVLRIQGLVLGRQGKVREALESCEAALKIAPKDYYARVFRARLLGELGRKEEAVRELRGLVEEDPEDETAKFWLLRFEGRERAEELEREHIAEQRRRQEEARDRRVKLDAWRKLSARTAHRVGNQVFAMKGAVRALKAQGDFEGSESIMDLEACLDRIAGVCAEFRRFSTDEAPKPRATDVRLLIHDLVRRFSKSADGIDIRTELAPLLPECRWDASQIEQAIGELLENAIRHTPSGKNVVLDVLPKEKDGRQYVHIALTNDGRGIDARYKNRVFDPFFSLRPGGAGLGLAIVAQNIKNHGGTIRETGEPGRFARFEIELPAQIAKEDSQ